MDHECNAHVPKPTNTDPQICSARVGCHPVHELRIGPIGQGDAEQGEKFALRPFPVPEIDQQAEEKADYVCVQGDEGEDVHVTLRPGP